MKHRVEPQKKIVKEKENDSQERKNEKSVFAELPKAKKSKGKICTKDIRAYRGALYKINIFKIIILEKGERKQWQNF